jgi:glutathione peroxidase
MKKSLSLLAIVMACACTQQGDPSSAEAAKSAPSLPASEIQMTASSDPIYQVDFTSIRGEPLPFSGYEGMVTLVVNTASRCGYTGQYAGLQELHTTFKDQGFTVLGVPSNDFGAQEPGSEAQIASFCEINYGVDFPLTQKTTTVGADQHPFWRLAVNSLGEKAEPKWNFHKVLVGRDGRFIQAYPSSIRPADTELVADIERALNEAR